jgi:hypothetical protein
VRFAAHELFNKTSFEIRGEYINFISGFGSEPLIGSINTKRYFKFPFKNFSLWWFSLVAEKNTLKSSAFCNLVWLCTILDLVSTDRMEPVVVDIQNADIVEALTENIDKRSLRILSDHTLAWRVTDFFQYAVLTAKFFVITLKNIIYVRKFPGGFRRRSRAIKDMQYMFVTYFPLLDKDLLKDKEFINKYFEPIQRHLKSKRSDNYGWLAINTALDGFSLDESFRIGKDIIEKDENLFFYHEFIRMSDLLVAFFVWIQAFFKYLIVHPVLARRFIYSDKKSKSIRCSGRSGSLRFAVRRCLKECYSICCSRIA